MEGRVLRVDAKVCHVEVEGSVHILPLRGRLFEKPTQEMGPVAVGDRVIVTLDEQGGAIDEVLPRTSRLARYKAGEDEPKEQVIAANISLVMVVASVLEPTFQPELVDRILAGAEREHVTAILTITKIDLDQYGEALEWAELYRGLGFQVFLTSTVEGKETTASLEAIGALVRQNVTVLSGASGVGKSALINTLIPGLNLRIGSLGRIRQGKHTTPYTRLIPLPGGGHILDTPGIRSFGLQNLDHLDLCFCFPEIRALANKCEYRNCTHTVEPKCVVLAAVDEGRIEQSRYLSYVLMLEDIQQA